MLEIVFVCTANRARSPVAALLLTARAQTASAVRVSSAGLAAREGEGWLPDMELALRRQGIEPPPHAARQLLTEHLAAADLAITMTEKQRRAVVRMGPSHMIARCFTLKETHRLMSSHQWRREWNGRSDLAVRLHELRPLVPPAKQREDIVDPADGGARLAQRVLSELMVAVDQITPGVTSG